MAVALTAKEIRVRAAPSRAHHVRVWYKDPDGVWRNLRALEGRDWVVSVDWGRSKDQPVTVANIVLWATEGKRSLSVFHEGSKLNRGAGVYAPALDLNTDVRIETATTAWCYAAKDADWRLVFEGYVQAAPVQGDTINVTAYAYIGRMERAFFITDQKFGGTGVMLEDVAEDIVDAKGLAAEFPLVFPAPSAWGITREYTVSQRTVLGALLDLTLKPAMVVRERLDTSVAAPAAGLAPGRWKVNLYRPDYENTTPHWTFVSPREVEGTPATSPGTLDQIRNRITNRFLDEASGEWLTVTLDDAASIADYGLAEASTTEGADSPINSTAQATTHVQGLLFNLSLPETSLSRRVDYCHAIELDDCCAYTRDGRHADVTLKGYVTDYHHYYPGAGQKPYTDLQHAGRPQGQYLASRFYASRGNPSATTAEVDQPVPAYGAAGAFTIPVQGNDATASLYHEKYVGAAWVNRTEFSTARTGSFSGTATDVVQKYRVAGQNTAGVLGPWKYVDVSVYTVTGIQPPNHAHNLNKSNSIEVLGTLNGTLGAGGSGALQVRVVDSAGTATTGTPLTGYDWVTAPVAIGIARDTGAYHVYLRYADHPAVVTPEAYVIDSTLPIDPTYVGGGGEVTGIWNPGSVGGGFGTPGRIDGGPIAQASTLVAAPFVLAVGVSGQEDFALGATSLHSVGRHFEVLFGRNGETVAFESPYTTSPLLLGAFLEKGTAPGIRFEVTAENVTTTHFTVRAVEITAASSSAQVDYFATAQNGADVPGGVTLTTAGQAAFSNLDSATSASTVYTVGYTIDCSAMTAPSVRVRFWVNDGAGSTTWNTAASDAMYFTGDVFTSPDEERFFTAALGANFDIKVALEYTGAGGGASCVVKRVDYYAQTGVTTTTLTPAADDRVRCVFLDAP